ncbi:PAS domain-containing protein [Aestuariispira insulae]|uniref:PAS domain-containing protein n=1 Tax=Aestuariispira insulae TaxID=1461337 RepID=A0A3D9HWC5_9PROT|nr:PAS domain-containing protein [Aestuariispira insulae]RED53813.1 PAS domain-containing protein [Aestuariispira insulae]
MLTSQTINHSGQLADDKLRLLYDYWQSLATNFSLPRADHFDVFEVPAAVFPKIFYADILRGPKDGQLDFLQRLTGIELDRAYGKSLNNKRLTELTDLGTAPLIQELRRVVFSATPRYSEGASLAPDHHYDRACRIVCPLVNAEGAVTQLIGAVRYYWNGTVLPPSQSASSYITATA